MEDILYDDCDLCTQLNDEEGDWVDDVCIAAGLGDTEQLKNLLSEPDTSPNVELAAELAAIRGHPLALFLLYPKVDYERQANWLIHASAHGQLGTMAMARGWCLQDHACWRGFAYAAMAGQMSAMELIDSWMFGPNLNDGLMYHRALPFAASTKQWSALRWLMAHKADIKYALKALKNGYPEWLSVGRRTTAISVLSAWKQHASMLDIAIALRPLRMSTYPELWLIEWAVSGPLSEYKRVQLLNNVNAVRPPSPSSAEEPADSSSGGDSK